MFALRTLHKGNPQFDNNNCGYFYRIVLRYSRLRGAQALSAPERISRM